MSKKIKTIFFLIFILLLPNINKAEEILIYADKISYDENQNIIANGNAKIFRGKQLIFSNLIIYNQKKKKIILPTEFTLMDSNNNYLNGSSGEFNDDLEYGEIKDIKVRLHDGSRIIGAKGKREKHIDIISKGVYSPCKSRIKVANFICPTWQLEGEKILHDNKNLFLYQKHSKMRILNTPIFYIPYIVTPSPLRKERKSGFLTPSLALNFLDTKTSQSISLPYYFNISIDKELTFTPQINYGGGVDSSQRFLFEYNQIVSGGNFSSDLTFDSNFENQNNNKWLNDASLITNYNKNINSNYRFSIESALQTSQNYIQRTIPDDDLSYNTSLSSKLKLEGFNLRNKDDYLETNINFYQTNQSNEDNKTTPTVLPNIQYYTGNEIINENSFSQVFEFYNIFRDTNTEIHSKEQQKISQKINISKQFLKYNSKIKLSSEIYNQVFKTEKKLISNNNYHSGNLYRLFPIFNLNIDTPFKLNNYKNSFSFNPTIGLILTPGYSNSNKISNEDSSNNSFSIENFKRLNRFAGSDKLDNSKRLDYGLEISNQKINFKLSQYYEFTNNSSYHIEQGNDDHLSDLLGEINYNDAYNMNYNFRYDFNDNLVKEQNVSLSSKTILGDISLSYLDQKSKIGNIINQDIETINYNFQSNKIFKFSSINFSGLYDLKKEINTEYKIGYKYFDECFGINLDFYRKSYEEDNLKPQDILTLMFSFKNIGSYKSSNLAVSENDKLDITWEGNNVESELFDVNN